MRFAHIADCHIGGWNDTKMKQLGLVAFQQAIERCISEKLDFILIAGDLFNTAVPQIELISSTAAIMKKAKDSGIPIYIIPGSHDFSPSGKTMLDVLEKAGLCENVMKVSNGKLELLSKNGYKIAGMFGRKGGLEKEDYKEICMKHMENEDGFKIFMFHTALDELKPEGMEDMEAMSLAELPRNFDYYAAGHVHAKLEKEYGKGVVVFPGALFPNNFKELEEFKHGGFYIIDADKNKLSKEYVPVMLKEVIALQIDCTGKTPLQAEAEINEAVSMLNAEDKIVLLRVVGELASGKPSDIRFNKILERLSNAYFVAKNTSRLMTKEAVVQETLQTENIEPEIINRQAGKSAVFTAETEKSMISMLMLALNIEKNEGEKTADYEKRVFAEGIAAIGLKSHFEDSF